jgi:hypothetical protein
MGCIVTLKYRHKSAYFQVVDFSFGFISVDILEFDKRTEQQRGFLLSHVANGIFSNHKSPDRILMPSENWGQCYDFVGENLCRMEMKIMDWHTYSNLLSKTFKMQIYFFAKKVVKREKN